MLSGSACVCVHVISAKKMIYIAGSSRDLDCSQKQTHSSVALFRSSRVRSSKRGWRINPSPPPAYHPPHPLGIIKHYGSFDNHNCQQQIYIQPLHPVLFPENIISHLCLVSNLRQRHQNNLQILTQSMCDNSSYTPHPFPFLSIFFLSPFCECIPDDFNACCVWNDLLWYN